LNINRINELAKKNREIGLSTQEKEEQQKLRKEYIKSITGNLKSQLENTFIVDEKGKKSKLKKE
jgi:uncharacterized protein YnzC (UPF0291/DUF896 family)